MKQVSKHTHILRNKKTYKVGAVSSLALLLAACGNSSVFLATSNTDTFVGELGNNTVSYASSPNAAPAIPEGVDIDLLAGTNTGGFADGDTLTNIQNIIGSAFADAITGNNEDNMITGNGGDDALYGLDGNDTIMGGAGEDFLSGGAGDDAINGGADNDSISGGAGNDILTGGGGNDYFTGGAGDDVINGGTGNNDIYGEAGIDTVETDFAIDIASNIVIDTVNNIITIVNGGETNDIQSVEFIKFGTTTIDIQDIWSELAQVERDKFLNTEAIFTAWLGEDAGYNYEGL